MTDFEILYGVAFYTSPFWLPPLCLAVSCMIARRLGRGHASAWWGVLGVVGWIVAARRGSEGEARQRRAYAIRRKHRRRHARAA